MALIPLLGGSGSAPRQAAEEQNFYRDAINTNNQINNVSTYIGCLASHLSGTCAWLQPVFQEPGASRLIAVVSSIRSTTRFETPSSDCTRSPDEISTIGFSSKSWPETNFRRQRGGDGDGAWRRRRRRRESEEGGGGA
ncbi:hypothetical protein F511_01710 [Dorcoceras hygrometricum]|nr:hypothetical protein F511_01710 [Dorcoceras hygrometricum]